MNHNIKPGAAVIAVMGKSEAYTHVGIVDSVNPYDSTLFPYEKENDPFVWISIFAHSTKSPLKDTGWAYLSNVELLD